MESLLIFIVIIVISAVSNWLKQKQEAQQRGELPPPPEGESEGLEEPAKRKPWDWETELRRLLEGESAEEKKAPEPPPLGPTRDTQAAESAQTPPPPPPVVSARPSPSLQRVAKEAKERMQKRMAGLKADETAFIRARKLDQSVASRLAQLTEASKNQEGYAYGETRSNRRTASVEALRVRAALGNPRTAREAIIAMEILGEPRGLRA